MLERSLVENITPLTFISPLCATLLLWETIRASSLMAEVNSL